METVQRIGYSYLPIITGTILICAYWRFVKQITDTISKTEKSNTSAYKHMRHTAIFDAVSKLYWLLIIVGLSRDYGVVFRFVTYYATDNRYTLWCIVALIGYAMSLPLVLYSELVLKKKRTENNHIVTFFKRIAGCSLFTIAMHFVMSLIDNRILLAIFDHGVIYQLISLFFRVCAVSLFFKYFISENPAVVEMQDSCLKSKVQSVLSELNYPVSQIQVSSPSTNQISEVVAITGFPWNRKLSFTQKSVQTLNNDELTACLYQKLGHMFGSNFLLRSIMTVFYSALIFFFTCWHVSTLAFNLPGSQSAYFIFLCSPLFILIPMINSYINNLFDKRADSFAISYGYGESLCSALKKMSNLDAEIQRGDEAELQLLLAQPAISTRINNIRNEMAKESKGTAV